MSDHDDISKGKVEILICSANLGNAQPDEDSWKLWVPEDGRIQSVVLDEPKYPLISRNDEQNAQWDTQFDENSRFDLIVFGLQESTFDASPQDVSKRSITKAGARWLLQ